jgi:predicted porin
MFYKLPAAYTATNASNMISYTSPEVSGFQGGAQYLFGENKSTAANGSDGNGFSLFAKYAQGPVLVTGAISKAQYYNEGDYTVRAMSASYDLGAAKLTFTHAEEKEAVGRTNAVAQKNVMNSFGVIVPMGAANFKATYTAANRTGALAELKGKQFGLGVDYALSKRTKLYTTVARVSNSGGNGTTNFSTGTDNGLQGSSSSHVAVGAYHSF